MESLFGGPSAFKPIPFRSNAYTNVQRSTPPTPFTPLTPSTPYTPSSPMSTVSSPNAYHRGASSTSSVFRDSDIGCDSPSRTASFVSQCSTQFSSMDSDRTSIGGDCDSTPVRDTLPRSATRRPVPPIKPRLNPPLSAHVKNNSVPSLASVLEVARSYNNSERTENRRNLSTNPDEPGCRSPLRATGPGWEAFYSAKSPSSRPSLCDSGDEDMESVLLKKNSELKSLRETMMKNENAILQVLEDKKRFWEIDLIERNREWKRQMEAMHQKSARKELALQFRIVKLRQENKLLLENAATVQTEKLKFSESLSEVEVKLEKVKKELADLRNERNMDTMSLDSKYESLNEDLMYIIPNIDSKRELVTRMSEISTHSPVMKSDRPLVQFQNDIQWQYRTNLGVEMEKQMSAINKNTSESYDKMSAQVHRLQMELENNRTQFEHEKQCWLDEKDKVIKYQKFLQFNYLQTLHKNRLLEAEVEQLTGELAAHDSVRCACATSRRQESLC